MRRKGLLSVILSGVLAVTSIVGIGAPQKAVAASKSISVVVDGKTLSLGVTPQVVQGTTLVPYKSVVAALGGKVSYNSATKKVTATKGSNKAELTIGSKTATRNGTKITLNAAPIISNGQTLVPIRFLADSFLMWVRWDSINKRVIIESKRTISSKSGSVTLTQVPQRIVTLSSSDTEIMFALGGKVVGRSTALGTVYPAAAKSLPEVGSTHGINFEKLASLKPDLVIASPALASSKATIEKLGAKVLLNSSNTYEDIQSSITLYGRVLGEEDTATNLISSMDKRLNGLKKPAKKPKVLILYGAPGEFVVALPTSYPGDFLNLAGGANVAANFPKMDMMPQYADFSFERIVAANPDVILMITHGDPAEVKASFKKEIENAPAWKSLKAVEKDQYEVLPNDLFAANPGMRAPDAIEYINNILRQVK